MSIHFTPNMSYCAVENTAMAMEQVVALMEEHDSPEEWLDSLNEYERRGVSKLLAAIDQFREYTEDLEAEA